MTPAPKTESKFEGPVWRTFFQAIQQFGISTVLLVLVLGWLACFVANPIIDSMVTFLNQQVVITKAQLEIMGKLEASLEDLKQEHVCVGQQHSAFLEAQSRQTEALDSIQRTLLAIEGRMNGHKGE